MMMMMKFIYAIASIVDVLIEKRNMCAIIYKYMIRGAIRSDRAH